MRKQYKILIIFFLSLLPLYAGSESFLPANGQVEGWVKTEKIRTFTEADLYGHINGGAEVFLEIGFEQLTLQYYQNQKDEISVEIYRMADITAAAGIYWMKCGRETPDTSLAVAHTLNRHQMMLKKNRYFIIIFNHSGSEKFKNDLLLMGRIISDQLPADLEISELRLLPDKGLISGSLRIIRGSYTLQAIYTLGNGDILSLADRITAVSADYADQNHGNYSMIVVEYPNPEYAKNAYNHIRAGLDRYMKIIKWQESEFLLSDFDNQKVVGALQERILKIIINSGSG